MAASTPRSRRRMAQTPSRAAAVRSSRQTISPPCARSSTRSRRRSSNSTPCSPRRALWAPARAPRGADVHWPHASPRRTLVRRGFSSYRRGLRMVYRILADAVVLVHAAFVAFVVLGGFLAWRWRWVVLLHVPCALWGVAIEYAGWICPLTPLENALRGRAGLAGYRGGFVEHYVIPALYPAGLPRPTPAVRGTPVPGLKPVPQGVVVPGPQWPEAHTPAPSR